MVGKRGSGHFEMIISFVFFVGFVFFLFVILKPGGESTISGSVVSGLYDSFEERVHTNLSSIFLKANITASDCFGVELPNRIFTYTLGDGDSYVTNLSDVDVNSGLFREDVDSKLNLENIDLLMGDFFYNVEISPEFEDEALFNGITMGNCTVISEYDFGSINERRVVSYSALAALATEYYIDYDGIKSGLRVPSIFDFAIIPETLTALNMEPNGGVPSSVDVVAKDYVVEVLYANGTVINEKISFRVW